jgi:hypothetical protein
MPVQDKKLRVTINDPGFIVDLSHKVTMLLEEMRSINVRNTPVKYETKCRWEDRLAEVESFLKKFVPQTT